MKPGLTAMQEAYLSRGPEAFSPAAPKQKPVTTAAPKQPQKQAAVARETRQQRWRRLHPEKYRAVQAALMRERRAAQKEAK